MKDLNSIAALALATFVVLAICAPADAGTLSGKAPAGQGPWVVYVESIPGKTFPTPAKQVTISQQGLMFQPHVTVVPVGTTVVFENHDRVAHNIFWPSISGNKKLSHNIGTWPTGEARTFKFDTPGVVPLLCNVHQEMNAYVVVVPTPYFAITDDSGKYTLPDLPDGQYRVSAWHEGIKIQTRTVSVASGAVLDFTSTN